MSSSHKTSLSSFLHDSIAPPADFQQVIVSIISFTALFGDSSQISQIPQIQIFDNAIFVHL